MAKFNANALIVGENLDTRVGEALAALAKDGGNVSSPVLLVQVVLDDQIGSAVMRDKNDLEDALETALYKWVAGGRSEHAGPAMIIVSAIKGTRSGDAYHYVHLSDYYI